MAVDKKISQLASGAPAQAGDEYVVARSGANYKLTLTNIAASMPPIGATTPNTGAFTTLSASSGETISGGNLTFSSTAQRITGDMSNATIANRLLFQNSVTNGASYVQVIPNGTASVAGFISYASSSDPGNTSIFQTRVGLDNNECALYSNRTGTGTYLPMTFYTGGSERVRIDTSGNVGIGTATANKSSSSTALTVNTGTAGNFAAVEWASGDTLNYHINANNSAIYHVAAGTRPWIVFTNGSERMRIDSSGNVGIGGTAAAFTKVDLLGTLPTSSNFSEGYRVAATIPSGTTNTASMFVTYPSTAAASFTLGTLAHFRAIWNSTGAGSAITTQYGFLAESSLTQATNNFGFYSNIASGSNRWNFYAAGTAENYFAGKSTNIGAFHVGSTNNPGAAQVAMKLDTNANQAFGASAAGGTGSLEHWYYYNPNGLVGTITTSGSATAYNTSSDRRLKTNIAPANDASSIVDAIQIVQHDWKVGGHTRYGVVAQDLYEVVPEAVAKGDDGDEIEKTWGVDYSKLVPILVKEIQSLRQRVAELEAK